MYSMNTLPQPNGTRSKPKPRGLRRLWDKTKEFIGGSPSHEAQRVQNKNIVTPWDTLRAALRGLESSAEVFPPLKAAITEITISLDLVQRVAKKHPEYDQLAHEFEGIARTLEQCIGEFGPDDRSGNVEYITKALVDQISHVNKKRAAEKNILSKIAEAQDLQDDVIKCHNEAVILFQNLQCEVSLRASRRSSLQRMRELLKEMSPVDEARYNSSYAMVARRRSCTKGTRVVVQEEVHQWAQTPESAKIYWMNGMAGTGKTTIAYTLCEWLAENQLLGANFFCSRTSTLCSSGRQIIPTIANQLAHYSHAFRSELCRVLDEDTSVCSLDVERQFKRLILQPILAVNSAIPAGVVVVVDALDECQENYIVKDILKLLLSSSVNMPVKFFVTSRPEPAIRGSMMAEINYPPSMLHLHDIQDTIVQGDIKLYLEESFSGMSPPPSEDEVKQLVARSGKLFIYAATVARYVMPERASVDPSVRLKKVLVAGRGDSSNGSQIKLKELDDLYMVILLGAFDEQLEKDEKDEMQLVLQTVLCAREPMTLKTLEPILGQRCTQNQLRYYLEPLRSVLHVSEEGLISTFHASFPDFMFDKDRSGEFHCNFMQHNFFLAARCFQVMSEKLHFNMCDIESSAIFDNDVENLEQRITQIDQGLMYSCRYWAEHLQGAGSFELQETRKELMGFLTLQLLFWIELLSLTKLLMIAKEVLSQAQSWLSVNHISDATPTHVTDAIDFVNYFAGNACSHSTPHLYISALPSFRRSSTVYENYYPRMKGLINIEGPITTRGRLTHTENHSKTHSTVFSSDGASVISVQGSAGPTLVLIRDSLTGLLIADPLELQTRSPTSVALSSDGTYAVVASIDFTITAYDTRTGTIFAGPLQGHTGSVRSVAISTNKAYIASGSSDCRVRVWDIRNGALSIGPGEGHTQSVTSVNFSLDGARVISGSADWSILVWDTDSCSIIAGPFKPHSGIITAVAFSPDGTHIASGSVDRTIFVSNTLTGAVVTGPIINHTNWVTSLVFSPDGTRIASGSPDRTVWISGVSTGKAVVGPLGGHTKLITSIAFSPDGTRIVTSAEDCASRVWVPDLQCNPETRALLAIPCSLRRDGWVINKSNQPIIWVPSELYAYYPHFLCELTMDFQGSSRTNGWEMILLGSQWVVCY